MNRKKNLTKIINFANDKIINLNNSLSTRCAYRMTPAQEMEWDYWIEEMHNAKDELKMLDIPQNDKCTCL